MGGDDRHRHVYKGAWVDVVLANSNVGREPSGLRSEPQPRSIIRHRWRVDTACRADGVEIGFSADQPGDFRDISADAVFSGFVLLFVLAVQSHGVQPENLQADVAAAGCDHFHLFVSDDFAAD